MFKKILDKIRGNNLNFSKFQPSKKDYNFYEAYGESALRNFADLLKKEHNAILLSVPECRTMDEVIEIRGGLKALKTLAHKLEMHAQKHKQTREKAVAKGKK